ncbi:YheV family putative zinc ribbon protein [Hafnia alvei]|uniref:YheV family putative zinc ribbon protein n=1 Tax=Hafnia alvei TaxID=569 RepID=UPI0010339AD0|nr:YheV family putative zinc ribbon protein [Hafnia alvei]TBL96068.1 YheV family putative metal-binding protein [Hafnia alvei]
MKKRFIAGANCPACKAQDTLVVWRENNIEHAECVKCGHQLSQPEADVSDHVQHNNQMIGIFKPE